MSTRTKAVTKDSQLEDPAAQGKRKRSTLADVTVNKPKTRGLAAEKGKAKEDATQAVPVPPSKLAGVAKKNKPTATTALPLSQQVLRAAAPRLAPPSRRSTRSSAVPNHVVNGTKVEPKTTLHVDAMEIDPPDLHVPPTRVNGLTRKPTSSITAVQKTSAGHLKHKESEQDEMEAEANRVFKKRRTSSEAPEDQKEDGKEHVEADQVCDIAERELQKHLQDIGREVEADPNGPDWEDLDAEDADDPMMVSEYVTEIFDHLKVVEVRFSKFHATPIHLSRVLI